MKIRVKLFAILRERAGTGDVVLDLPEGATVRAAADSLSSQLPRICEYARRVAYAVNREYVSADATLKDGDELAVIPPVSGG
jgi:molybdopterin converting factor subunit 1